MGNTTEKPTTPAATTASAEPQSAPRSGTFQVSNEPVVNGEAEADAHKFEGSATPAQAPSVPLYEDLGQLPVSYQEETLFLVARDPRWLFAYWDFNWWNFPASEMRFGMAKFYLKFLTGAGSEESLIEINPEARNWYAPVQRPDTDYFAEIGYFQRDGMWKRIVRSSLAHTPSDAVAPESQAVDFATVPAHITFERLLALVQERMAEGETLIAALAHVAGEGRIQFRPGQKPTWTDEQKRVLATLLGSSLVDRVGLGSDEIDQLLRKSLQEKLYSEASSGLAMKLLGAGEMGVSSQSLFSAFGASWSAQPFSMHAERGFYMHVNAEIIFYGGTHPDAAVTVAGQRIQLSADGTFRYHFTLPDGDFEIPVVATSPDKVEQRSATLAFRRGTDRQGDVGATGQPAHLSPLIGKR